MAEVRIKPPEIGAKKLLEKVRGARPFYLYGVQNPKVSPTEAAVAMKDTWRQIMSRAETAEKWAANRLAAGVLGKGADRLIQGVEFGIGKYLDFASEFYPYMATKIAEIKRMPKVTIEDRVRRAAEMIKHNYNFKRKKRAYTISDLQSLKDKVESTPLPG